MLLSSRLPSAVVRSSSMAIYDNNTDRSHQTNSTSLIPPTSLPKYFNVPFAIQHGYFRCIRYLLQLDYDPNERDCQLRTPLILCSYIDNNRWSLSLAQNLLEKSAKIALEDHARRNAMHHACALQRSHLVQLYLSCLDFNIEAKDYEGNTCLHYVAITGNCEIAELLIRSAEKLGIRLDQYVNRDGCSAAVLALKYGHIECANQITHRDSDEFFVVPRPLSIYETPPTTDDNQTSITTTSTTIFKKKKRPISYYSSSTKIEPHPSTLSFGLLKIIFNDSDTSYSTRLAGLCKQDRQHFKYKKQEALQTSTMTINKLDRTKSTLVNGTHSSSTEALVNESQSTSHRTKQSQINFNSNENLNNSNRTSPRTQLLMQQHLLNKSTSFTQKTQLSIDDTTKSPRPTTAILRNAASSRLSSAKKKTLVINPIDSLPKQHPTNRPISAVVQPPQQQHSFRKSNDSISSIREAKGAASRYNKPEELFGLRPEELFAPEQYQPKILDQRFQRQQFHKHQPHIWQQDVDQIIELYNIHHSSNYRKSAAPPQPSIQTGPDPSNDLPQGGRARRMSITKNSSTNLKPSMNSKQATFTTLNIPRRNSISRPSTKLANT